MALSRCWGRGSTFYEDESHGDFYFPMWVLPVRCFLAMSDGPMKCHQELLAEGKLVQWTPGMFTVFVSHQWLGSRHCDPRGEQLKALRDVLQAILSGSMKVQSGLIYFISFRTVQTLSAADCKNIEEGYLWLDFVSIPQLTMRRPGEGLDMEEQVQQAIASIPAYANASDLFWALCPPAQHEDAREMCGFESWVRRGWCRMEMAAASYARREKPIVMMSSRTNVFLTYLADAMACPPGEGDFAQEADKVKLLPIMEAIIEQRLQALWSSPKRIMGARVLQAMQGRLLGGLGSTEEQMRSYSLREAAVLDLQHFLEAFRFRSPLDPGYGGLGPVHCAAAAGNVPVLRQLALARADMNQKITVNSPAEAVIQGETPLLLASLCNESPRVIQCLLELRADPHSRNLNGHGPLQFATFSGHTQLMTFYLDLGLEIDERNPLGDTALIVAATKGRPGPLRLLLERAADVNAATILGNTALMSSVLVGSLVCCRILVEYGANAHAECQPSGFKGHVASRLLGLVGMTLPDTGAVGALTKLRGQTPLSVAKSLGFTDIVQFFESPAKFRRV